jgi:pyruvate formate lyase activating enzyme
MIFGGFEKCTLVDYPGKVACMVYTIGCNFRCSYCHNPELVDETVETRFDEKEILSFLDARKGFLDGIVITGGEPSMHAEIPLFIEKVKEKGYLVKLDTNGTNPKMLKELTDAKLVDYVAMDIKSPLRKYSQTVARPADINAIRESIQTLLASSVEYEFRTTVVKPLLPFEDFAEMGEDIRGAKRYFLQKFVPTKILNPQFKRRASYSDAEFEEIKNIISPYVEYCGIR